MTTIRTAIQQFKIKRDEYSRSLDQAFDEFLENNKTDFKEIATDIYYEQTQIALKLYKQALKEYYEQK